MYQHQETEEEEELRMDDGDPWHMSWVEDVCSTEVPLNRMRDGIGFQMNYEEERTRDGSCSWEGLMTIKRRIFHGMEYRTPSDLIEAD